MEDSGIATLATRRSEGVDGNNRGDGDGDGKAQWQRSGNEYGPTSRRFQVLGERCCIWTQNSTCSTTRPSAHASKCRNSGR